MEFRLTPTKKVTEELFVLKLTLDLIPCYLADG